MLDRRQGSVDFEAFELTPVNNGFLEQLQSTSKKHSNPNPLIEDLKNETSSFKKKSRSFSIRDHDLPTPRFDFNANLEMIQQAPLNKKQKDFISKNLNVEQAQRPRSELQLEMLFQNDQ